MDHLFSILNYFGSLRATRRDDPFTKEWKAVQRRAWASTLFLVLGFGVGILIANTLDGFEGSLLLGEVAKNLRPSAAYVVIGGYTLLLAVCAACWLSVYRFAHKHWGA